MNNQAARARKNMDVMTLVVIMAFVSTLIGLAAFFMIHDVIPFVNNFTHTLAPQPRNR
jgi:sorbitol-specific phosphotransferase system component IIBC